MADLAIKAFQEIFHEQEINRLILVLNYSNKFKPYNANIRKYSNTIEINMSEKWREISDDIQVGLIQSLLMRLYKIREMSTDKIELYHIFMKKIHIAAKKIASHPVLEDSFSRVNEKYFYGMIEKPNLVLGGNTRIRLGSYAYGSDTITISSALLRDEILLDYVMYHELLHKKYKFNIRHNRSYYHTKEFRSKEKEFPESQIIEKRLREL